MDPSKAARAALMLSRPKRALGGTMPYGDSALPIVSDGPPAVGSKPKMLGALPGQPGGGGGGIPGISGGGSGDGNGPGGGEGNGAGGGVGTSAGDAAASASAGVGAGASDSGVGTGTGDSYAAGGKAARAALMLAKRPKRADGGAVDDQLDKIGYRQDNPAVSRGATDWLKSKQKYAEQHPKLLSGVDTGYLKSQVNIPIDMLHGVPGAMDETPHPGTVKYDRLMADVKKNGWKPDPISVAINHKGKPYIYEGNHRAAVARAIGQTHIPGDIHWMNGAEEVDGPWHPRRIAHRLSVADRPKRADGGGVPMLPERPDVAQYRAMDPDARDAWKRDRDWRSDHPSIVKPGDPQREENFNRWHGSSKIRDGEGNPLRLYHATPKSFDTFIPGGSHNAKEHESGPATWLSPYPDRQPAGHHVGGYQGNFKSGTNVMPVHADIRNPLVIDSKTMRDWARQNYADGSGEFPLLISPETRKMLLEDGYDGILWAGSNATSKDEAFYDTHGLGEHPDKEEEVIALHPPGRGQIKSAIGNRGQYNPDEMHVNYADGGMVINEGGVATKPFVNELQVATGELPETRTEMVRANPRTGDYHRPPISDKWKAQMVPSFADGGTVDAPPDLNQQGLYSHAAQIAQAALPPQVPLAQAKGILTNKGVKPDEMKWSGFDEKFGSKPMVTRDEVVQHFKAGLPNVKETVLRGDPNEWDDPEAKDQRKAVSTKYHSYQLPGGENYRELLLHLPSVSSDRHREVLAELDAAKRAKADAFAALKKANETGDPAAKDLRTEFARATIAHEELQEKVLHSSREASANNYGSSHWDEPNVLAHLRMSDRRLPGGKKALHLEEMQSDWAQEGRKKGFNARTGNIDQHPVDKTWRINWQDGGFSGGYGSYDQAKMAMEERRQAVPSAPYVDSTAKWTDLGLKRALHEAAKGGYDKLLITPGEEQAKRYDLGQHVDHISYYKPPDSDKYHWSARGKNGEDITSGRDHTLDQVASNLGKEIADRIKNGVGREIGAPEGSGELRGVNLKVGGEGMKSYYDKIVPTALQKLAKKHDPSAEVKLHGHELQTRDRLKHRTHDMWTDFRDWTRNSPEWQDIGDDGHIHQRFLKNDPKDPLVQSYLAANTMPKVHSLDITPKMRASILKGQPAFASGGAVVDRALRIARADGGVIPSTMSVVPDDHPAVTQAKQVLAQVPQQIAKPKVDPMSVVHSIAPTPQADAEQVMSDNASRGLIFPQDATANRLRMKLARHKKSAEKGEDLPGMPTNPRTVIKAPEGLPDFVAGRITPEDWVSRHEKLLSPGEISDSADWYKKVYGTFLQQTKGDEAQAKKYMRGWLVAQQNVDVSGAMNNVLLQNEQMKRGVPEGQMRAAGMPNPTAAARSVLADKPITGVGQKISDFVDAAEGKDVRSWMANHPDGGKPFVVDVHTGRDTGLVDQELINHLTRLGYDPKAIKKLKVDMHASPSETQYENRAHFGHELTDHLNRIGWQGREDWTPSEVQAVGWMGMTKLTANQADDVVSGLDRNTRRLSMELAPGEGSPWHQKYGDAFAKLAPADQYELTHHMTQKAIEHASKLAGIDVRDIVHGTGGWQQYQNPSTVGQALATKEGAEIAANALGHLLQQTEVWSNSVKPVTSSPKGFAVDFIADGDHNLHTDEGLRDFWGKVMDADPLKGTPKALFQGYQPIRTVDGKVGIRALIDRGGVGTMKVLSDAVEGPIRRMVESLPFDIHAKMHEAEIMKARNDWNEDKHGQAYKSRLVDLLKRDPAAELGRAGQELEEEFTKKLREKGAKVGRPSKASGGSVHRDPYKHALRVVSTAGRYSRGGGSGKTDERSVVDRALQLTSKGYRK